MKIVSGWHIHSRNSCDQACMAMAVSELVREAKAKAICMKLSAEVQKERIL